LTVRYEIKRMANIKAPDGAESVFYEVWDVADVDGEVRLHRNHDRRSRPSAANFLSSRRDDFFAQTLHMLCTKLAI